MIKEGKEVFYLSNRNRISKDKITLIKNGLIYLRNLNTPISSSRVFESMDKAMEEQQRLDSLDCKRGFY